MLPLVEAVGPLLLWVDAVGPRLLRGPPLSPLYRLHAHQNLSFLLASPPLSVFVKTTTYPRGGDGSVAVVFAVCLWCTDTDNG